MLPSFVLLKETTHLKEHRLEWLGISECEYNPEAQAYRRAVLRMTVFSYLKHSGKLLHVPVPKRKNEKHKGYLECLFILQMTLMHNVIKT